MRRASLFSSGLLVEQSYLEVYGALCHVRVSHSPPQARIFGFRIVQLLVPQCRPLTGQVAGVR